MLASHVSDMRRFSRFYTRLVGVLDDAYLASPFTLVQVRVLYELAHARGDAGPMTARELEQRLDIDRGYLSRTIRVLVRRGLVVQQRSARDGRERPLALTAKGARTTTALEQASARGVRDVLVRVAPPDRADVVAAMRRIEHAFEPPAGDAAAPIELRSHRPGDMGWIVHRHGVLYAAEYGWDERFEALVARITSDFITTFDPARERCWVAERDGEIVGSVFLVAKSRTVAQLRLLYVEPSTRGAGLGSRLVRACTDFARAAGYKKIVLWTNSVLVSARRIYEAEGYRLVSEERHSDFGVPLVGQLWSLPL